MKQTKKRKIEQTSEKENQAINFQNELVKPLSKRLSKMSFAESVKVEVDRSEVKSNQSKKRPLEDITMEVTFAPPKEAEKSSTPLKMSPEKEESAVPEKEEPLALITLPKEMPDSPAFVKSNSPHKESLAEKISGQQPPET